MGWEYNGVNYFLHAVGVIVNTLTILVISKFKVITRPYKLMIALALADIGQCIASFLNIPKQNYYVHCYHNTWLILCYIQMIIYETMIGVGAYVYLILTIDRFVAIVWALQYKTIMTTRKYIIYTVFFVSHHIIVFLVCYLLFPNEEPWAKKLLCEKSCTSSNLLNTYARYYVLAFITMVVIINTILCVILVVYLFITRQRRKSMAGADAGSDGLSRATNTLIFVSVIYAVLYIQLFVLGFLAAFNPTPMLRFLAHRSDSLFYVNNNINPFVYYVRMPEIRNGFHRLIGCHKDSQKTSSQRATATSQKVQKVRY